MAEKLTQQQREAVENRGGKLLVSAAAGSGKTKVLVDRLMSYLTDSTHPANIDEFLIITYTKAAASELRGKIAAKLSEHISQEPENRHLQQQLQRLYMTNISTVHSFCGDVLRQYAYRLDLSADFRVGDENECRLLQEAAMQQVLEEAYIGISEDGAFRAFVDTQGIGRDDRLVPEILLKVYISSRCHLDPEGWLKRCLETASPDSCTDVSQTLWGRYLMDSLFFYLDLQLAAMQHCAELADAAEGMEKVAALFWNTVYQLRTLRESKTWDEVVKNRSIDYGRLNFSKKVTDLQLKEGLKAVREACKKGLAKHLRIFTDPSDVVLKDLLSSSEAVRGMLQLVDRFAAAYDGLKRQRRILDFSDLEHKTLDLLWGVNRTRVTAIADEIGSRFREVMVDEYQDSNAVQDAIYTALTDKKQNCFMVGDVKQSIYQFRLADPGIFLEKYHSYQPAAQAQPGEGRKVVLSKNFRSCNAVLSAANSVFEVCMSPRVGGLYYGPEEALYEGIPHEPLEEPEVEFYAVDVQEDTYEEEAAFTAKRIHELLDGKHYVRTADGRRPIGPEDIVILLRSPNSVGHHFSDALDRYGIRCITGGGSDLLNTKEITVLRSLLQTIHNPQQDIPLVAVLLSPLFCFTADEVAAVRGKHLSRSFYNALKDASGQKVENFLVLLNELRTEARSKSLSELLEAVYVRTRIDSVFATMDAGEERSINLQLFYQLAVDFEAGGQRDLGRFLDYLETMQNKGMLMGAEPSTAGSVSIMSIHKSKGLEFPVVFLCGLSRSFNRESQRAQVLCDKELGIGTVATDSDRRVRYPTVSKRAIISKIGSDSVSEELRVLYVAMTRAKDRLIMTYASDSLEKELQDMISRMNMGCDELLCTDVSCPGRWVLLSALKRTEAGELFAMGGQPARTEIGDHPWKIRLICAEPFKSEGQTQDHTNSLSAQDFDRISEGLHYRYPYLAATEAPSKQTATERKGRIKDREAAENAQETKPIHRTWRKPSFIEGTPLKRDPSAYGKAVHSVLQFIDCEKCVDAVSVKTQVGLLAQQGVISQETADVVDCEKLADFFATELGTKVRTGKQVLREFKFSILDDGQSFNRELQDEKILLQGVVDCAIIEPDGIIVIDFKTDRVTEQTVSAAVEEYRYQVEAYAESLRRIFGKPVKQACLYFFRLNRFFDIC